MEQLQKDLTKNYEKPFEVVREEGVDENSPILNAVWDQAKLAFPGFFKPYH